MLQKSKKAKTKVEPSDEEQEEEDGDESFEDEPEKKSKGKGKDKRASGGKDDVLKKNPEGDAYVELSSNRRVAIRSFKGKVRHYAAQL